VKLKHSSAANHHPCHPSIQHGQQREQGRADHGAKLEQEVDGAHGEENGGRERVHRPFQSHATQPRLDSAVYEIFRQHIVTRVALCTTLMESFTHPASSPEGTISIGTCLGSHRSYLAEERGWEPSNRNLRVLDWKVTSAETLSTPNKRRRTPSTRKVNGLIKWTLKRIVPAKIKRMWHTRNLVKVGITPIKERECNLCGFEGFFSVVGRPLRLDAMCPNCGSMERHRLMMLALQGGDLPQMSDPKTAVLHFAAEPILERIFRERFDTYVTADFFVDADVKLNMEAMDVEDEQYDVIIANHVLEHVDDHKASTEIARVLSKGGVLLCQVPIVEGWATTYEDPSITTDEGRWLHFGQGDHVRYYGADFRQRIAAGGLKLTHEFTAEGTDVLRYGLLRGEKTFVFEKI